MAKHYTCDICGKLLDKIIAVQDGVGELYFRREKSTDILLNFNTAQAHDICFPCIVQETNNTVLKRKKVIENG